MQFEQGRPCGGRHAMKILAMKGGRFGGRFGEHGDDGHGFGGRRGRGGGHGGGPRGGGHRGGPRGGRMFAGGELRLLLLHLIAEQPRHGYDLIRAISDLTGGEYAPSPGVVYPTLSLLVDEGLALEEASEGPRKAFAATGAGRAELAGKDAELDAILARLKALGEERDRAESPPVRRAIGNLHTVLRNRAMAQDFDKDTALAIADILDDAARRIERL